MALSGLVAWFSLPDLPYTVPLEYLFIRNGLWGAWGLASAFGAYLGKRWSLKLIQLGGLGIVVWYWADRIFLAQSDYARASWPLAALLTVLGIALVLWIFSRPAVKNYFQENGK